MALSPAMNQGTATTTNATHSPSDPAGHGAFTYMVMYSVRAQSSRYIGLSRSSDTMPHRTTKCSFPVFPLRSHSFPLTAFLYLLLLLLPLLVPQPYPPAFCYHPCPFTRRDIVIHYSILRHHARARVPLGRYSHCMPCRHTATYGRYLRERKREGAGEKETHTPNGRRPRGAGAILQGDSRDKERRPREREYNSMYNV